MMSNWVLYDLKANYKFIIKIPMELIENLCFICIHYIHLYFFCQYNGMLITLVL
jgi:hypothetical protein